MINYIFYVKKIYNLSFREWQRTLLVFDIATYSVKEHYLPDEIIYDFYGR